MYNIDLGLLIAALNFYTIRGYRPLSAPLLVDSDIVGLTLPSDRTSKEHLGLHYVGSAEQSFYQLMKDGLLPKGKYMLLTPCHRDEVNDESHLDIFLKLELISVSVDSINLGRDAYDFYDSLGDRVEIVKTEELSGFDLELNGVEVGSFGSRVFNNQLVSYGTGLALPRYTQATKCLI